MLDMLAMLVHMVLILMLELMVATSLVRGLLMLSLRPRLMLLFSTKLMDMLDILPPLTPIDILHMLDTPLLLPMLVPMVLTLMLELMVATTLARGQLMLSLRPMPMLSLRPMLMLSLRPRLMLRLRLILSLRPRLMLSLRPRLMLVMLLPLMGYGVWD